MRLKRFDTFLNESKTSIVDAFKKNLKAIGMEAKESNQSITIKFARPSEYDDIADLRISVWNNYASIGMIEVYEPLRKKGIGTKIYQALLDAALSTGLKGIHSAAFDDVSGTGQQRSPGATALLLKLAELNGGKVTEVTPDPDDIKDLKADHAPFYGPPYYDIQVDKSGKVKRVAA